jgi:hypothetical protein
MIWGVQYRSEHAMSVLGGLFGVVDQTYTAAGWAIGLGILAFLVGLALLIAALVQPNTPPAAGSGTGGGSEDVSEM